MQILREKVQAISSNLLDIMGEVLKMDLSADQIGEISDKKYKVMQALFRLQEKILEYSGELDGKTVLEWYNKNIQAND